MSGIVASRFARFLGGFLDRGPGAGLGDPPVGAPSAVVCNAAFLRALAGDAAAEAALEADGSAIAGAYGAALRRIRSELAAAPRSLGARVRHLADWTGATDWRDRREVLARTWSVFFPDGARLLVGDLEGGGSRRITYSGSLSDRGHDPMDGFMFTAAVSAGESPSAASEWLRRLDGSLAMGRASVPRARPVAVITVADETAAARGSVRTAVAGDVRRSGEPAACDVYVFDEEVVRALATRVLVPAAAQFCAIEGAAAALQVWGLDGGAGRSFNCRKAIAALWHVLIDDGIVAAWDAGDAAAPSADAAVRPGALAALSDPRWGASAIDASRRRVDLGFSACLVPVDVDPDPGPGDFILGPALARAAVPASSGGHCEAIDVGTAPTGALVAALLRHRPYAPTFLGSAAADGFLLGSRRAGPRPGFFDLGRTAPQPSDRSCGAEERVILFSAFLAARSSGSAERRRLAPLPGGYATPIPLTTAFLRWALRSASFAGEAGAAEAIAAGTSRLAAAAAFVDGGGAARRLAIEERGWGVFYGALEALQRKIAADEPYAVELQGRARALIAACRIG